jgi:CRISP-associated protein Cas1
MGGTQRLFVKITRESLPQVKDKYPFIYLERGRLEIDDSSLKWLDAEGQVVRLPVATLNAILLGPGTSLTLQPTVQSAGWGKIVCSSTRPVFYPPPIPATSITRCG